MTQQVYWENMGKLRPTISRDGGRVSNIGHVGCGEPKNKPEQIGQVVAHLSC